jgi:hypothetical protein
LAGQQGADELEVDEVLEGLDDAGHRHGALLQLVAAEEVVTHPSDDHDEDVGRLVPGLLNLDWCV